MLRSELPQFSAAMVLEHECTNAAKLVAEIAMLADLEGPSARTLSRKVEQLQHKRMPPPPARR